MSGVLVVIASLSCWVAVRALTLASGALSGELRGWVDRIPVMLLRLAAQQLPVDKRQGWIEEWTGELAAIGAEYKDLPLTRRRKQAFYALDMLRGAGQIGRVEVGEDGELIAAVEQGTTEPEVLARRLLAQADPTRRGHWRHNMGGLLTVAVDRLSMAHATEVAECMASDGRRDVALWWAQCWLRPERTCRRRPGDAVAMFRRLRESWGDDPAELRDAFLRGTDHWSWGPRQEVERRLDEGS